MHSPLEWNRKYISLLYTSKGQRRFSCRAAVINSPDLSITRSCGLTLLFCTGYLPPVPGRVPFPLPSKFLRPSSFSIGQYTHTGVIVSHYPLLILLYSEPNLARAPDLSSSVSFVFQYCIKICICLWILSKGPPEEKVLHKRLFVMPLEAVNMTRPCFHGTT